MKSSKDRHARIPSLGRWSNIQGRSILARSFLSDPETCDKTVIHLGNFLKPKVGGRHEMRASRSWAERVGICWHQASKCLKVPWKSWWRTSGVIDVWMLQSGKSDQKGSKTWLDSRFWEQCSGDCFSPHPCASLMIVRVFLCDRKGNFFAEPRSSLQHSHLGQLPYFAQVTRICSG